MRTADWRDAAATVQGRFRVYLLALPQRHPWCRRRARYSLTTIVAIMPAPSWGRQKYRYVPGTVNVCA